MTELDFHFLFFPVLRSGVVSQARGSAYIEMQRTKVTCAVYPYAELPIVHVIWMLASWGISKLPLIKLSLDHTKSMDNYFRAFLRTLRPIMED